MVQRLFILLMTLTMLVLSTCSMKTMLWYGVGMETPVPVKPYSSKGMPIETQTSLSESCSASTDSIFADAEVIPFNPVNTPLFLLSVLLVLLLALPGLSQQKNFQNYNLNYSDSGTVPIYLKLGQLIYYA